MIDKGIKEIIRNEDARKSEYEYTYRKFRENIKLINIKARNSFSNKATTLNIKHSIKFNHYSIRDTMINSRQIDDSCPRCNDWED